MVALDELRSLREAYKSAVAQAKASLQEEFARKVEDLTREELVALSEAVHALHRAGYPKAEINAALGVYSNVSLSKPIWDAVESTTDLRRKGSAPVVPDEQAGAETPVVPGPKEGEYVVTHEGTHYLFTDVAYDPINEEVEFVFDTSNEVVYRYGWLALLDYFAAGEANEGSNNA